MASEFQSDGWHLYSECPKCHAGVRHRLLWAALSIYQNQSLSYIINNKKILHFAPEASLSKQIKKRASIYKTADFVTDNYYYKSIDYNVDISFMPDVPDCEFDCIIASDVLEHVLYDKKAIKEVYRVLKPNGHCILTVPQQDDLEDTLEDLSDIKPEERKKKFGIADHWRIYGRDFKDNLVKAGFDVIIINESCFDDKTVKKYVLFPPVLSTNSMATNYRNIYIGRK